MCVSERVQGAGDGTGTGPPAGRRGWRVPLAVSVFLPGTCGTWPTPRTLGPPGTQRLGRHRRRRRAPAGSHLAARHPVGRGYSPWCSHAALSHVGFVFVCLCVFVLIQIYFMYETISGLETFRPKRAKKIREDGVSLPQPALAWEWAPPDTMAPRPPGQVPRASQG